MTPCGSMYTCNRRDTPIATTHCNKTVPIIAIASAPLRYICAERKRMQSDIVFCWIFTIKKKISVLFILSGGNDQKKNARLRVSGGNDQKKKCSSSGSLSFSVNADWVAGQHGTRP